MKTRLLIAEADVLGMFDRIARHLGFDVETASAGLECWSKLQTGVPEVLVIDAEILWGGGDGVLARLRDAPFRSMVPVVFIMGPERPDVLSRRFGVPARFCFQKPLQLGVLLGTVLTETRLRKQLQAAVC